MVRVLRAVAAAVILLCAAGVAVSSVRVQSAEAGSTGSPPGAHDPPVQAIRCRDIVGPFHTVGARVLNSDGERYIPYGINIVGLAHPLTASTVKNDEAQISASASDWCANTVRLQVAEDLLVRSDGVVSQSFLDAVEQEVAYARSLGLLVALNVVGTADAEYMPTARSESSWSALTKLFGSNPGVIFDLFNEPRNVSTWKFWRDGGTRGNTTYYGMQTLATFVRTRGAHNLLWIEGPHTGASLRRVWSFRLREVGPIMYDIHRPPTPHDDDSWTTDFGFLANDDRAPVLDGEWADYARTDAPWACWDDAPTAVPAWLRYLRSHQIGLIASKLAEGELVASNDLDDPTRFKSNWSCTTGLDEGAGSSIMRWFRQQNGPFLYAAAAPAGADDCYDAADACSLATALRQAQPGDTIELVTSGSEKASTTWYSGGFRVSTPGTSATEPVTIEPAPGVTDPILDGGEVHTVMTVGDVFLDIDGVTIQRGSGTDGGGISSSSGGTVTVARSTFWDDAATTDGGAIDNGDNGGSGSLTVSSSTFAANSAGGDGGAIDNGDNGGTGTLTVTGSTFSADRADNRASGIDDGDNGGTGTVTIGADLFVASCTRGAGTWTDEGWEVGTHGSCFDGGPGDRASADAALLGPLADNGGGIETLLPLAGNPAIGIVPNPTTGFCPTVDERGRASKAGRPCVAGAVQGRGRQSGG